VTRLVSGELVLGLFVDCFAVREGVEMYLRLNNRFIRIFKYDSRGTSWRARRELSRYHTTLAVDHCCDSGL